MAAGDATGAVGCARAEGGRAGGTASHAFVLFEMLQEKQGDIFCAQASKPLKPLKASQSLSKIG
eukprot:COSAG04_NODE_29070_length_271_cov_0.901163_1_plen_63_part_10